MRSYKNETLFFLVSNRHAKTGWNNYKFLAEKVNKIGVNKIYGLCIYWLYFNVID